MDDQNEGSPYQIQTYVFLDLETLGFDDKPRILEISMIAVSRSDLIQMKTLQSDKNGDQPLPRVLHKYTQLYYPKKLIIHTLEEITGLSNYNMNHLPSFQEDNATAINLFFKHLPEPVCLIAHNGKTFDFPILKAEMLAVNSDILNGVVCADSLIFVRHFEKEDIKRITELAKEFQDSDFEDLPQIIVKKENSSNSNNLEVLNNGPSCSKNLEDLPQIIVKKENSSNSNNLEVLNNGPSCSKNLIPDLKVEINKNIYETPKKSSSIDSAITPPRLHKNGFMLSNNDHTPEHNLSQNGDGNSYANHHSKAKRVLYHNQDLNIFKKPFSQPTLYRRIFRKNYSAHRAESDAVALMQICAFHGEEFITWVDQNFIPFQSITPRWTARKSFML